jgi:nitrogenase molybdenum-iron protein NifN
MTAPAPAKTFTASRNACKLCAPLGASLVYKGLEGCVPLIHGSQGCATYIRRYLISHFKEPVDIASSNFSEASTVYGGSKNFIDGMDNVIRQYRPRVIGIASTCLSETIGEDIPGHIQRYGEARQGTDLPVFIHSSTPSYCGSHAEGFHNTVLAVVRTLARSGGTKGQVVLLPGMVSPADLRYLKEILGEMGLVSILFPDYSETLDNVHTHDYQLIPSGGTPLSSVQAMGDAAHTIEFGTVFNRRFSRTGQSTRPQTAGEWLESTFFVRNHSMPLPIGIDASDRFMHLLEEISGKEMPLIYRMERGRLIDAYVDAHKYVFGKKALIYGEEDWVLALADWLTEIGMEPIFRIGADYESLRELAETTVPDLLIGNSKGYYIARERGIPLVRMGFPIHDRFGASRLHHLGYRGTQALFDSVVNALIEYKQSHSPVGYKYL